MGWFSDAVAWVRSRFGGSPTPAAPAPGAPPDLPQGVPPGQPVSVDALVARMQEIDRTLPADDGVGDFNRMYLRVTELVRDRLVAGWFANPAFVTRLDLVFAGLHLDAVGAATPTRRGSRSSRPGASPGGLPSSSPWP